MYGTVDELNSVLGIARGQDLPPEIDQLVARIQNELFALGVQLATPDPAVHHTAMISTTHATALEQAIDRFEEGLEPLQQFILPGGTLAAAQLHLARTVRRPARTTAGYAVTHVGEADLDGAGDLLESLERFTIRVARAVNRMAGRPDVPWQKPTTGI